VTAAPAERIADAVETPDSEPPAAAPEVVAAAPQEPETQPAPAPAAPQIALLKSDEEGVSLMQSAPEPPGRIVLDTIGYSDSGVVELAGRASAEAVEIRVYLDNRVVTTLPVETAGNWRGQVPDVDTGVYTLRVDELDAEGRVTSRLETPFKREAPAVLAAATEGADGPIKAVTVQTGDTLWAIARDRYGEGVLYVKVFEANRSAIRDPDLIYPGQVFDLPAD
jgi:nucleoid-associated protein YgaU